MRPVFIGGTGRCGTTILRKTLALHPDVAAMPGELRLIVDSNGVLDLFDDLTTSWDPYRADRALDEFHTLVVDRLTSYSSWYPGHFLDGWVGRAELEVAVARLWQSLVRYNTPGFWTGSEPGRSNIYEAGPHDESTPWLRTRLANFVEDLYRAINRGATHYVEDTPYNVCHVHRLRRVFVGCHVVHIRRHPLDVLASFKMHRTRTKKWTSDNIEENAKRIAGTLHRAREDMTVGSGVSFLVYLEDFVEEPERALRDVCDKLGLPWHQSLLDGSLSATNAHIGRWEEDLTNEEVEIARPILESHMGGRYE